VVDVKTASGTIFDDFEEDEESRVKIQPESEISQSLVDRNLVPN
jgi:hypothetical protein